MADKADGAELTAEIESMGRRALAMQMDLTDLVTVPKAVAEAHAACSWLHPPRR